MDKEKSFLERAAGTILIGALSTVLVWLGSAALDVRAHTERLSRLEQDIQTVQREHRELLAEIHNLEVSVARSRGRIDQLEGLPGK